MGWRAYLLSACVACVACASSGSSASSTLATSTTAVSRPTTSSADAVSALAPAAVPPVVPLCSTALSYAADGGATPLFCDRGGINTLAWQWYAQGDPPLMALGPSVDRTAATAAICQEHSTSTGPIEESRFQLASAYYGWQFDLDPAALLGSC